jgi:parallel beta-helix repeat protein
MISQKREYVMLTLSALLLLFLLMAGPFAFFGQVLPAVHASGNPCACDTPGVYYVSIHGSDTTGNGSSSSPYATITHAVAQAAAYYASSKNASTVIVEPGTYAEMVVITTPITLMSASGTPSNTIINASGLANAIVVVGSTAAGSVVEGFSAINADNHGIFVQDSLNVRIENNFASDNGLNPQAGLGENKAIQLTGTSDSSITGNTIVGNLYGGAGITDDGVIDPSWNASAAPGSGIPAGTPNPGNNDTVSGNTIINNRPNHCAIVVSSYNSGEGVSNNVVSGNVVTDNENGIIVAADTPNTVASYNTVIGNIVVDNGEGGVIVHSNAPGDVVTDNTIMNNVFDGNGYLPTLEGVIVGGEGPVAAVNTTIESNTFENEAIGILIVNGNNTMVGGNDMTPTVMRAVNGTVTQVVIGPSSVTMTATLTQTVSVTATGVSTSSSSSSTTSSSSTSSLNFTTIPVWAYAGTTIALIIGVIVGFLARRPKK